MKYVLQDLLELVRKVEPGYTEQHVRLNVAFDGTHRHVAGRHGTRGDTIEFELVEIGLDDADRIPLCLTECSGSDHLSTLINCLADEDLHSALFELHDLMTFPLLLEGDTHPSKSEPIQTLISAGWETLNHMDTLHNELFTTIAGENPHRHKYTSAVDQASKDLLAAFQRNADQVFKHPNSFDLIWSEAKRLFNDLERDEAPVVIARPGMNYDDSTDEGNLEFVLHFAYGMVDSNHLNRVEIVPTWVAELVRLCDTRGICSRNYELDELEPAVLDTATALWSSKEAGIYQNFDGAVKAAKALLKD